MKRLLTLLVMMVTFGASAQHVAQKVQELKNQKSRFVPISVFNESLPILVLLFASLGEVLGSSTAGTWSGPWWKVLDSCLIM